MRNWISSLTKRRKLLLIVVILLTGIILSLTSKPVSRNHYLSLDFYQDSRFVAFWEDYNTAVAAHSDWVKDPEIVALRVAGYPNTDNIPPDRVTSFSEENGPTIVTITDQNLMDDSLIAIEYRVELTQSDNIWQVEWVGSRVRCRRGFSMGWTSQFCS
jgi:hypothetical protein